MTKNLVSSPILAYLALMWSPKTFVCGFYLFYNPGKNIWQKVKKSSKIKQDFKNLLPNFAFCLRAIAKV